MSIKRVNLNILLIILCLTLGGLAVWISRRPVLILSPESNDMETAEQLTADTSSVAPQTTSAPAPVVADTLAAVQPGAPAEVKPVTSRVEATEFSDIDPRTMVVNHPFRREAMKVINGRLEENDSVSRHKILSYCEHLRTSYTTRDIDFIRQVFSDNALIIVGHVVRTGGDDAAAKSSNQKVSYSLRTKKSYIERLERIFNSKDSIDVRFSDFKIMRHPTVAGIYGVTLRQEYSTGSYSDDGYLFLLWDFRNKSMPLIHVRTWQPRLSSENIEEEIIGISDFNLE